VKLLLHVLERPSTRAGEFEVTQDDG
jgi:hypothetical protein